MSSSLKLDWCSYEAAKYAVEKWHYSQAMPASKNVYVGVWEDEQFKGAIIFGLGSGNATNGQRFGLERMGQMAELTRVALRQHKTPVSRLVAIALKMLRRQSPNLRLVISMADPQQGHLGVIYQAGNWVYSGVTKPDVMYFSNGEWVHHRTATSRGSARGLPSKPLPPKHRYLMPLDDAMRAQILPLAKPYPKRATSIDGDATGLQPGQGGSSPTVALQEVN